MPVYVFEGGLGSGKTLAMSVMAAGLAGASGLPVYANYCLNFARPLRSLDQLFALERAVVAIDEFHVIIDSRNFASRHQIEFTQWVLQSRKAGLVVLGTTQRWHQIDKRVRGIIDLLIDCRKFGSRGAWRSRLSFFRPSGEDVWSKMGTRSMVHRRWMYGLYDTLERVYPLPYYEDGGK